MKKKILTWLLVLAMITGVCGAMSMTSQAAPTCYQQGDSRWGNIYYGNWALWQSGCGILSTVNAVNYLTGNFIPPTELAQWAYDNNYFNGSYGQGSVRALLYANVTAAFGSTYGFSVSNLTYDTIYSTTLKNHLISGGTAIVHCPNHFMAINAYNASTGQYLVYDSAANESVRQTTVDGTWLTADQIHANTNIRVDWFCLVTKTASTTPNLYTAVASVAGGEGTVHFGNNITSAQFSAGTVVPFQVTPAEGYVATEILVGGTSYTIQNDGADTVYQFTMPEGNCGIVVTFEKAAPTLYDVSTSITGGEGTVHFGAGITSASLEEGTIVNFQTTPASGYRVNKIWVGNTFYTPENNGGDAVYQFVLPAEDTVVEVEFVAEATVNYKVRCGTFSSEAAAAKLRDVISSKGYTSFMGRADGQYIVYIGIYGAEATAQNKVAELKNVGIAAYVSSN